MGAYLRRVLIQGWALIQITIVSKVRRSEAGYEQGNVLILSIRKGVM